LASWHRVYAFDMLGHGLTDKPQRDCYGVAELVRFTIDFLSALGEESLHLVGNSLGGRIALECTRIAPARVRSMVLVAPAGVGRQTALSMRLAAVPVLGDVITRPSRMGHATSSEQDVPWLPSRGPSRQFLGRSVPLSRSADFGVGRLRRCRPHCPQ